MHGSTQPDVSHRVRHEDILAAFADTWHIDSIDPVTINTNSDPCGIHAGPSDQAHRQEGTAMLTAQGRIETGRASRYLVQLCEHLNQMARHDTHRSHTHNGAPPSVEDVEQSDTDAVITFDCGRCTLRATADSLILRVEAAEAENGQRIQNMLTQRLQTVDGAIT